MNNNLSIRQVLPHLVGILTFLSLPFLFAPESDGPWGWFRNIGMMRDVFGYSLLIGFFYLNYFVLVPALYFQRRYVYFAGALVAIFACVVILPTLIFPINFGDFQGKGMPSTGAHQHMPQPPQGNSVFPFRQEFSVLRHISHNIYRFLGVFFFSMMLRIANQWKQTQREKTEAELLYLKAQIDPHFLFNTLNGIYAAAIEERAHKTSSAIVKLSGLMRYVLNEANADKVPLSKEIAYLNDYIALQQLRLADTIQLTYNVVIEGSGHQIAPLLLIPFIENAFKHGVNPEENADIRIDISVHEEAEKGYKLTLQVENAIVAMSISPEKKSGVGIANARRRLALFYPAAHTLSIYDDGKRYRVELTIDLCPIE